MIVTVLTVLATIGGLHTRLTLRLGPEPEGAHIQSMVRLAVSPIDSFDDGCTATQAWRPRLQTTPLCLIPVVTPVDKQLHRSTQSLSATPRDVEECIQRSTLTPALSRWREVTACGITDGLRPEPAGLSRKLHRRVVKRRRGGGRRTRCPKADDNEDEKNVVWGAVLGAVVGVLVAVHPMATWAYLTVGTGVYMLWTDLHFSCFVCAALSVNYWCAVAWVSCAVSADIAVMLGLLAITMRGSVLLFPDVSSEKFQNIASSCLTRAQTITEEVIYQHLSLSSIDTDMKVIMFVGGMWIIAFVSNLCFGNRLGPVMCVATAIGCTLPLIQPLWQWRGHDLTIQPASYFRVLFVAVLCRCAYWVVEFLGLCPTRHAMRGVHIGLGLSFGTVCIIIWTVCNALAVLWSPKDSDLLSFFGPIAWLWAWTIFLVNFGLTRNTLPEPMVTAKPFSKDFDDTMLDLISLIEKAESGEGEVLWRDLRVSWPSAIATVDQMESASSSLRLDVDDDDNASIRKWLYLSRLLLRYFTVTNDFAFAGRVMKILKDKLLPFALDNGGCDPHDKRAQETLRLSEAYLEGRTRMLSTLCLASYAESTSSRSYATNVARLRCTIATIFNRGLNQFESNEPENNNPEYIDKHMHVTELGDIDSKDGSRGFLVEMYGLVHELDEIYKEPRATIRAYDFMTSVMPPRYRAHPRRLLIAFSGTDTWGVFVQDLKFCPKPCTIKDLHRKDYTFPGKVHAGIADSFKVAWRDIERRFEDNEFIDCKDLEDLHVDVVGHSFGGALALLTGVAFARSVRSVTVYTIGCPRVFDEKGAQYCASLKKLEVIRIMCDMDIIPCLPLKCMGYKHVGSPTILVSVPPAWSLAWQKESHSASAYRGLLLHVLDGDFNAVHRTAWR
jgi:hypothetical protein